MHTYLSYYSVNTGNNHVYMYKLYKYILVHAKGIIIIYINVLFCTQKGNTSTTGYTAVKSVSPPWNQIVGRAILPISHKFVSDDTSLNIDFTGEVKINYCITYPILYHSLFLYPPRGTVNNLTCKQHQMTATL
jgi:hypothetical protein